MCYQFITELPFVEVLSVPFQHADFPCYNHWCLEKFYNVKRVMKIKKRLEKIKKKT